MSAWLHNMSVPPRSTLRVKRQVLAGRRFAVDVGQLLSWPLEELEARLAREGDAAALAMISGPSGCSLDQLSRRTQSRAADPATPARLRALFDRALASASIPDRVGVVLPAALAEAGPALPDLRAALAVLARVSGPLYLPRRAYQASLVRLAPIVVVFPEETP